MGRWKRDFTLVPADSPVAVQAKGWRDTASQLSETTTNSASKKRQAQVKARGS